MRNREYSWLLDDVAGPDPARGPRCDDCGVEYGEPPYYTFEPDGCTTSVDGVDHVHDCTGNMCPDCAGPDLFPDDTSDPRWAKPAWAVGEDDE